MQPLRQQLDHRKLAFVLIDRHRAARAAGHRSLSPQALEIQPTYRCNYRCRHCSYWNRNRSQRQDLNGDDLDSLCRCVEQLQVKTVYLSGAGEPLLAAAVPDRIKSFREAGAEVALLTNGSRLDVLSPHSLALLKYVQVSLPAASAKTYQDITGRDCFHKVLCLPWKIRAKCGRQAPQLTALFVITRQNLAEAVDAVTVARDAGFDCLRFRLVEDFEGRDIGLSETDLRRLQESVAATQVNLDEAFTNLRTLCEHYSDHPRPQPTSGCVALDLRLLANIAPDGEVYCCVCDIARKELSLGNIHDQPLTAIWNSNRHTQVIQQLQARYLSGGCPASCRGRRYNELYETLARCLPEGPIDECPAP